MPDPGEGVLDSTSNTSQDLALLEQEDENLSQPEKLATPLTPEEVKEPSEEKEEKEEKLEEKEPEEKKEDRPPFDRPTMQQMRDAFPDLFKKFPSLRDIYYREQEFSQIFSTVEEAKNASSGASSFDSVSNKIFNGDIEGLLSAVKQVDETAFGKLAQNVLPAIYKMSPDLHWQATLPMLQNLVRGFWIEGQKRGNDNIKNSAEYLSDFIFGDIKVARGEKNLVPEAPKQTEEQARFEQEKARYAMTRLNDFSNSVKSSSGNQLRSFVDDDKVDPDGIFSNFIKETIVGKVLQEVDNQLVADKAHMKYMNSLWNKARENGFGDEWKSRIISAYLARAKSLVPATRAKFVSEAMGTSSRASGKRKEIEEKTRARREPGPGGRTSSERNGPVDAKNIDWSKTSDLDLLEDRVTFRRSQ